MLARTGDWLSQDRQRKVEWGFSYQQIPPSSGILSFLSLQPASSSAPAFIFPVKRAGGRERRTLNNQHLCCSSVFSPSLLSSRFLHSLREGGSGDHQRHTAALRCGRLNVNHTGNLGNRWAQPPANADWSADREPEVTSPHRSTDGTPRAVVGSCTEPNKQ